MGTLKAAAVGGGLGGYMFSMAPADAAFKVPLTQRLKSLLGSPLVFSLWPLRWGRFRNVSWVGLFYPFCLSRLTFLG